MKKTNSLIGSATKTRLRKVIYPSIFILLFAIIGALLLHGSKAAGPYASLEPEGGTVSNGATSVTDSNASNGSYVQFGTESGGGSTSGGCEYNGTVAPCIGSATTGASGWGTPTFDDEFSGSSINTQNWSTSWFNGSSQNNVTTSPSNVSVSGGDLILTLSSSSVGASVTTNPNGGADTGYQFGTGYYVEGSVYFPGSGSTMYNWPAFWTDGQSWPTDGEIDIAEILGGQLTSNYHSPEGANNGPNEGSSWENGFHTYGVDREDGENYIYWDGSLIRSYASDDGGAPQYVLINIGCSGGCTTGTASQVKVDYVRVWKKS